MCSQNLTIMSTSCLLLVVLLSVLHCVRVCYGAVFQLLLVAHYPDTALPGGAVLFLRGDSLGLSWDHGVPMKHSAPNTWTYSLTYHPNQQGNIIQFKPLVNDDTWMIGANVAVALPPKNSTAQVYPWFYKIRGTYSYLHDVYSPQLDNRRDLVVYVPGVYLENSLVTMTDVLVMHDGQNLFNASTAFGGIAWMCQDTVDSLIYQGAMRPIMIIGVDNTPDRINEYTYSYDASVKAGGKGDLYLDFLEKTVLPFVQKYYRMEIGQPNVGILGSSLGGLISCYAGWTRNKVWSNAGCMSSSFWWNNQDFNNTILNKPTPPALHVYLDSGDSGPDNDDEQQTITVRNHMEALGFQEGKDLWYYLDKGGKHNEYYWGKRFWVPMKDLYPPTLTPTHQMQ